MADFSTLQQALVEGDASLALSIAEELLGSGEEPFALISGAVGPAMAEVGQRFEAGEYFVPELLMAARATKSVFEIVRPLLATRGGQPTALVVLGTVQGDLHDIGKNLVRATLEGNGFEVLDLGVDVSPAKFVSAARENKAQLVGLSALLTSTLETMRSSIQALRAAGLGGQVKIMVGGAPVTQSFADEIGADGFAPNAVVAAQVARQLVDSVVATDP